MGKSDSLAVNEVSERDIVLLNCYLVDLVISV